MATPIPVDENAASIVSRTIVLIDPPPAPPTPPVATTGQTWPLK